MRWKLALGVTLLVIATLIGAAYLVLSSYDYNKLKPGIAAKVRAVTGRDLKIEGDIDLEIGLRPTLIVQKASFQNASWGSRPEMAEIGRFELQVSLLPLIRGKVEIRRLVMVRPDILVETDKSGRSNVRFAAKTGKSPAQFEKGTKQKGLPALTFRDVRIVKGRFRFKDGKSGLTYAVMLDSFRAGSEEPEKPISFDMKGTYEGTPFSISGTLGPVSALLDPSQRSPLKAEGVIAGARLSINGFIRDFLGAKNFDLAITAQGPSLSKLARLTGLSGISSLESFKASAEVSDPAGKLFIEKLNANVGLKELGKLVVSGAVKDAAMLKGLDIRFGLRGKDISNLGRLTKTRLPFKGTFKISGRVNDSAWKKYRVSNLKVALADNFVHGSLGVDVSGKRPRLRGTLTSPKIDLRKVLSKKGQKGRKTKPVSAKAPKEKKIFPDRRFSLEVLRQVDARIKLKAGNVLLPRLALRKLFVDLELEKGRLRVRSFKSRVGGGTIDASLDLIPRGKKAKVISTIAARHVDVGRILKELKRKGILEGELDADICINGQGNCIASLMSGLNGKTVFVMGGGRINNNYVELLGIDLASGIFRLINPFKDRSDYTKINCFVSGFNIKDGIAKVTALVLDTERMSVIGDGSINLKTEALDLSLKPSPKRGINTGIFGKLSMSFGQLAKPFKLAGTLGNPSLAIDPKQTALTFGKAAGGMALFGPLGIAAALAGSSPGGKNPCLLAIEAAKKGVRLEEEKRAQKHKKEAGKPSEGFKGVIDSFGNAIQKLFGD